MDCLFYDNIQDKYYLKKKEGEVRLLVFKLEINMDFNLVYF